MAPTPDETSADDGSGEERPARPELVAVGAERGPDADADADADGDGEAGDDGGQQAQDEVPGAEVAGAEVPEAEGSAEIAAGGEPAPVATPGQEASADAEERSGAAAAVDATAQAAFEIASGAASSVKGVAAHLARSRRWMVRDTPNGDTLRADIARFAAELPGLRERGGQSADEWGPTAEMLALAAAEALGRGDNLEAWNLLWAGEREAIDGLRAEEVRASATATIDRAKTLLEPSAISHAKKELGTVEEASTRQARSALREGRIFVDRLSLDVFRRLHQDARRISGLSMLAVAFLLAGALATLVGIPSGGDGDALSGLSPYLTVVTFGAAGAVLSLVLPWREKVPRPVLLDFVNPVDLMVLRIAMGAAFALIFVAVMQAGVQSVVQIEGAQAYPWALAAGFSERLLDKRLAALDAEARDLDAHH